MARNITVPLGTSSMEDRARELTQERLLNMFPEVIGGEERDRRRRLQVHSCPGCTRFAQIEVADTSARVNRVHNHKNTLYASIGSDIYTVAADGTATMVATIGPPSGAVFFETLNNDLAILQNGFLYVLREGTLTKVPNLPRVQHLSEHDGRLIVVFEGGRQFAVSELDAPFEFEVLNFFEAAYEADVLHATVRHQRYQMMIGANTIEYWVSSGYDGAVGDTVPFIRSSIEVVERGALSRDVIAKTADFVFFVSSDQRVYQVGGNPNPQKISHYEVEKRLREEDPVDATAYEYYGHVFYAIRFADVTWVYDASYGLWHERQTNHGAYIAKQVLRCGGKNIVVPRFAFARDGNKAIIGVLDDKEPTDMGFYVERQVVFPPLYFDDRRMGLRRFEVDVMSGVGETCETSPNLANYLSFSDLARQEDSTDRVEHAVDADSVDVFVGSERLVIGEDHERLDFGQEPKVLLDFSDDAGKSWSKQIQREMGGVGLNDKRLVWSNLGLFRKRVMRLSCNDPVPLHILAARGTFEERDTRIQGLGRDGF